MTPLRPRLAIQPVALAMLHLAAMAASAQEAEMATVEVVSRTPLPGIGIALSQVPANVQTLLAGDVEQQVLSNVADLLNNNLGSVSVSNGTGNPYQNDVSYRGFQASSLLGAPVGLSVYFDGVRMNEPFGSIVNWDLIPMNAISSVNLAPGSNPMFGLNTLGGAVVVNTKNGADDAGTDITLLGGAFNRRALNIESGWVNAERHTDQFVSLNLDQQDGYRRYSGSNIKQFFGKTRWHSDDRWTDLELSGTLADSAMHGTQALPLSMLHDPQAAYTYPDRIANQMALVNLKGSHWLSDSHFLNGNVYFRRSVAQSTNSNAQLDDGCFSSNGDVAASCRNITNGTGTAPNAVASNPFGLARYTGSINTALVNSATRQETLGANLQWSSLEQLGRHNNSLTLGAAADLSRIRYDQNSVLARLVDFQTVESPNSRYYIPATGASTASNLLSSVGLRSNVRNLSLFGTNTLELHDRLSFTASGGYNIAVVNQNGNNSQYLNDDGGYNWTDGNTPYYNPAYLGSQFYRGTTLTTITPATVAGMTAGPQVNALDGNHVFRRFNPALGFNWNPARTLGFFGGYSESMRAPTSVELSCADPARPCALPTGFNGDPDLKAVVARTFELGARGKLSADTSWNLAAYSTRTSNDIQFMYSSATTGYFNNVGDTERKGIEWGLQKKTSRLNLSLNMGWVKAVYRTPFTTAQGVHVVAGNRIAGIPDSTFKLRGTYVFTPEFTAGANLVAASGQYAHGDEGNTDPNGKVPGYALMHLDMRYKLSNELTFYGLVNNLFDKKFATFGTLGTNVYTGAAEQFRTPAAPRALWIGLIYAFGGRPAGGSAKD